MFHNSSMYRFLIIDDEPVVREGISAAIDWASHGFELVGTCRDGREGLQAVEELRPDVVLTDICMPFVDGLELAAAISDQYPGTRTILLTGYDEFEYAQEAVKLNVRDFLLKPITADELREILESLRGELDTERKRREDLELLHRQLEESLPVYRERFLNNLAQNRIPPEEAAGKIALLNLGLTGPFFIALLCDRDRTEPEDHLGGIAIWNEVAAEVSEITDSICFSTPDEEIVILLSVENSASALADALECAEAVSERVKRVLARTVSIGIGDTIKTVSELPSSVRTARTALEQRFILGPDQIITIQQVRGVAAGLAGDGDGGVDNPEARFRLVHAIKTGASGDAACALRDILAVFRTSEHPDHCHVTMNRILADLLDALEAVEINYREIPLFRGNPFDVLGRMKTIEEIERWFLQFIEEARELIDRRRLLHSQRKAVAAEAFIRKHYANPDLALQTVCSALAVSKSYLSPIFKSHAGKTFVEYLTETRMHEAETLLSRTDFKVYEIAERVGFRDSHYFSLTFRKQTGLSPSEYRERSWSAVT